MTDLDRLGSEKAEANAEHAGVSAALLEAQGYLSHFQASQTPHGTHYVHHIGPGDMSCLWHTVSGCCACLARPGALMVGIEVTYMRLCAC